MAVETAAEKTYWEALQEVADYLGYTESPSGDELDEVRRYLEAGHLEFLYPEQIASALTHEWSFLAPAATLTWRTNKEEDDADGATVSGTTLTDTDAEFLSYGVEAGDEIQVQQSGASAYEELSVASVTSETVLELSAAPDDGDGSYSYYVNEAAWIYPLPSDFGVIQTPFFYGEGTGYAPLRQVGPDLIVRKRSLSRSTGTPRYFGVRAKSRDSTAGQEWELLIFPTPSSAKTVHYRYTVATDKWVTALTNGQAATISGSTLTKTGEAFGTAGVGENDRVILTSPTGDTEAGIYLVSSQDSATELTLDSAPGDGAAAYEVLPQKAYPLGGTIHWRTLLACCKAVAEREANDQVGLWAAMRERMLAAGIDRDLKSTPKVLGIIIDPSDRATEDRRNDSVAYYDADSYLS